MGGVFSKKGPTEPKQKPGIVKHREAAQNRVNEVDVQVAELKSRINKLKQYRKKIETQLQEQQARAFQFGKEGKRNRAIICLKHKKFLNKELDKLDGAESMLE